MSSLDLQALLAPVSESAPTGANLEYEPDFAALEEAAVGKPERQMGGGTIPGEPPNFKVLFTRSNDLLRRSKDLRIASHLTRACIDREGFVGLNAGLSLVRQLLGKYWATVHPQLDPEDDNDPTMRVSALSALVSPEFLSAVRAAPLVVSQVAGPISLRHLSIAAGEIPQPTDGPKIDTNLIDAGFREVPLASLQAAANTLQSTRDELKGLAEAFQAGAGAAGPDFSSLDRILYQAQAAVRPRLAARGAEGTPVTANNVGAEPGAGDPAAPAGAVAVQAAAPITGTIRNREDVVMMLDKICGYYERHEPSSPLPLLLQRCRKLAALSFLDIVKDLAPTAVQQVELIGGITKEKAEAKK
jgi:type VI secretion system protein ImpA